MYPSLTYFIMCAENYLELPGIIFHQEPIIKGNITFDEEVNLKGTGIWLSIPSPEKSILSSSSKEPLAIYIRTCFSGPFELPEDYESASPAYLIRCSRKVEFQKTTTVTVKIHHYACLESEEDCDDMVFLSASSTPEIDMSGPKYRFRKIEDARVSFRPGHQVGEITLKHFYLIRVARRRRLDSSGSINQRGKSAFQPYRFNDMQFL